MIYHHAEDCAIKTDGPCTCGTEEVIEELLLEDAGIDSEED